MVKRKLDAAVDESSANQKICKFDATVHNLWKNGGLHLAEPGLMAGWLTNLGKAWNFKSLPRIKIFNFPYIYIGTPIKIDCGF